MSTTSSNLTFSTKYQQLVSEYSKLRNQVPLLKKAVLSEQTRNAELLEEAKIKDQRLRKCDSEIESLSFRNQQLTKRVESLQTIVEELQKSTSHPAYHKHDKKHSLVKKSKLSDSQSDFNISSTFGSAEKCALLEEELRRRLTENESLHKRINESELETEAERKNLQLTIEGLEHSLDQCKLELAAASQTHDQAIKALKVTGEKCAQNLQAPNENGHDYGATNGMSTAAVGTSGFLTRSPATYSFDASGGSGSDTNEELIGKSIVDNISPGCSNYSSITHSSTALENAERLQEEHLLLIEDLRKQLKEKQRQVAELEREKEKISLDNQLLSLKYARHASQDRTPVTSSEEDWSKYTTDYYGSKITNLSVQLQQEQSKVVHFDNECRNMLIRLHNAQECVEHLTTVNRALVKDINDLKDETETTKRNYEEQMRTLSEHLAREICQKTNLQDDRNKPNNKRNLFR